MRVLHLIDSLHPGGAEQMAVTMANALVSYNVESYLCATREEGILKETLSEEVNYLFLRKKNVFDISALLRLNRFIKEHKIEIVHAHATSFFYAVLAKMMQPRLRLIWHDHYGKDQNLKNRKLMVLKPCSFFFDAIISVNEDLKSWALNNLKAPKVYYLRNFVLANPPNTPEALKGTEAFKIICVANLRPQKDHLNLLRAYKIIKEKHPFVSLHLVGIAHEDSYHHSLTGFIAENGLKGIYFYGAKMEIPSLLKSADLGVLSSNSEGLPVALLEYGVAGLAVVCTDVGQCKEVVGLFGKIVPPKDAVALAEALLFYIENEGARVKDATEFSKHVLANYTERNIIPKLLDIYKNETQSNP